MRGRRAGIGLVETIICCALFSLLLVILTQAMNQAQRLWRDVSAGSEAELNLKRAAVGLTRDLQQSSQSGFGRAQVGSAPFPGDAVWCLSAVDDSGAFRRMPDGVPFWRHNVLYYTTTLDNASHLRLFGVACQTLNDGSGYDVGCPHKVLIRKEIDTGTAFNPSDTNTEEKLIPPASISTYLTQPNGYSVSGMYSEAGVTKAQIFARDLVTFRLKPVDPLFPMRLAFDVRAVSVASAAREVGVDNGRALNVGPYTTQYEFDVVPTNP